MLVKICGLRQQQELDTAALGAQMCGFIFASASPRALSMEAAACLNSHSMLRVGVFTDNTPDAIAQAVRVARLDCVQLHGDQPAHTARELRKLPSGNRAGQAVKIIRVLWPARYKHLHELEADMHTHAPSSDMFLLDAGNTGGGTGQVLSWEHLRGLSCPRPWLLAGGLHAGNVRAALSACTPHGIDCNSQLEQHNGYKDTRKITAVLEAIKGYCHE